MTDKYDPIGRSNNWLKEALSVLLCIVNIFALLHTFTYRTIFCKCKWVLLWLAEWGNATYCTLCQILNFPVCFSCFWYFVVVLVVGVMMVKLGVSRSEPNNSSKRSQRCCEKVCIKFPFPLIVWWAGLVPHALILKGPGTWRKGVTHTSQAS